MSNFANHIFRVELISFLISLISLFCSIQPPPEQNPGCASDAGTPRFTVHQIHCWASTTMFPKPTSVRPSQKGCCVWIHATLRTLLGHNWGRIQTSLLSLIGVAGYSYAFVGFMLVDFFEWIWGLIRIMIYGFVGILKEQVWAEIFTFN